MKWIHLAAPLCVAVLVGCQAGATKPAALETNAQKNGYTVGFDIGRALKKQPVDLDLESVSRGLADAYKGTQQAMPDEDMAKQLMALRTEVQQRLTEQRKQAGEKALKEGEAFLARNKSEPGVVTTASGLQYKITKAGTGKKPTAKDTVTVHYRGKLLDSTEFDSSHKRGQPATFPVSGVIAGWIEALQLMPVGSTWTLYIPPKLAYAENGSGPLIGPNATLIFEVELLEIKKPEK